MLVLSRKTSESIVIDGRIVVKVVRVEGEVVKLGIEAPLDIPVYRQEIYDEIQRSNREALNPGRRTVPRLPRQANSPLPESTGTPTAPT
jgi:carbon storage regulator